MRFFTPGNFPVHKDMYFIYGHGGTGKTTLLKQFKGNKILISFDMSYDVVKDSGDVWLAVLTKDDLPNIQSVIDSLIDDIIAKRTFDVICLDNVTALQNYVLSSIEKSKDNRQNYNAMQEWFRELGAKLRRGNITVYATAHAKKNKDELGGSDVDMNEITFNAFTSMFDLVGWIYLKNGERMIDLDPEQGNNAKNRIDDRKLINADELVEPKAKEKVIEVTKKG